MERKIEIETPIGKYNVWTKCIGKNSKLKLLLLHGGPGGNHELFECFENYLPQEGIEIYYYNQLGSYLSDQPKDNSLWTIERFVDEVEQVRKSLGLNKENFILYGHSWGGILAIEYALLYQDNLKGLIISNMISSCLHYSKYVDNVLCKEIDKDILKTIKQLEENNDYQNPMYMELLMPHFYNKFFCRLQPWPEVFNRAFTHLNNDIYYLLQGPSELSITGKLSTWNRTEDLIHIKVPTLIIGAKYDTMDPEYIKSMANQMENASYFICPNGSHCSMWDDQQYYFSRLIQFIKNLDNQQQQDVLSENK
ncbi:unnamed protein product [Rotaria sp. Silwood1]|nr:unnamed protein product [Rotaria sp. Silwood1]CAF3814262.1 unnamed protein product [Rotaria sp. Silwood1]CAF4884639.1 unnamed protein product [Rotaria sp. Silwood1]